MGTQGRTHERTGLLCVMDKKMQIVQRTDLSTLIQGLLGVFLAAIVLSGCAKSNISDRKIEYIDIARAVELFEKQKNENDTALFIDTRRPERFAQGHIPSAINMRTPDIDLRYGTDPALERYKNLIVYGENPGTANSHAMAKRLIEAGYNGFVKKRVKVYLGGWTEWESTGLSIEMSKEPETQSTQK